MAPISNSFKSLFNSPALGITVAGSLLLKNQQRDTLDTAAIVAPLAYGGTHLFNSLGRKTASSASNIFTAVTNPVEAAVKQNHSFNHMKKVFKDRGASKNTVEEAISGYMRLKTKHTRDLGKELESLNKFMKGNFVFSSDLKDMVEGFLANPSMAIPSRKQASAKQISNLRQARNIANNFTQRRQLVSNALVGAMYDSSSPSDILNINLSKDKFKSKYMGAGTDFGGTHLGQFSSILDRDKLAMIGEQSPTGKLEDLPIGHFNDVINDVYSTLSDRPTFVSSLKSRLTKAKHLSDPTNAAMSFSEFASETDQPSLGANLSFIHPENFNGAGVLDDYQDVVSNLKSAKQRGRIQDAFIVSEKIASGQSVGSIEDALGLEIRYLKNTGDKRASSFFVPFKNKQGLSRSPTRNSYIVRDVLDDQGNRRNLPSFVSDVLANRADIPLRDIEKDAGSVAYWGGLDTRLSRQESGSNTFDTLNSEMAGNVRNRSAVFSSLPVYTNNKGKFSAFGQLDARSRTERITQQTLRRNLLPLGSESGIYEGVLQDSILEMLHPFTLHSMDKQESVYRSVSKNIQLMSGDDSNQFFTNQMYGQLTGEDKIPETGLHIASIAPEDKALFNSLPDTQEEFLNNEQDIQARFGLSDDKWAGLKDQINSTYEEAGSSTFDAFGRLGETEFMLDPSFADKHRLQTNMSYEMDSKNVTVGQQVSKGEVIGWKENSPVLSQATGIVSATSGDDEFKTAIYHELGLDGSKVDISGVKGQAFVTDDVRRMRDLQNALYKARGDSDYIPEGINAIADMTYYANKADVGHLQTAMLGDVLKNAFSGEDSGVFEGIENLPYKPNSNFNWDSDERSIFDLYSFNGQTVSLNVEKMSKDRTIRSRQVKELFELNQQVIENANTRVREKIAEGYQFNNQLFSNFTKSGSSNLESWSLKNNAPSMMRAWNHTSLFASNNLSLTYDMETFASMSGHHAAVRELNSRRVMYGGGSIEQSVNFAKHLIDPTANPITNTVDVNKAFPTQGTLTNPAVRRGSIFDDSISAYTDNFNLDLGEGGKHRTVPVLGTGAYSGTSPNYTQENQQVRDYQKKVQDIAGSRNFAERDKLVDELHGMYQENLLTGKGSVLRPYSYDPNAVTGFLRTKTTADPFDVHIGPDVLNTIKDSKMKAALQNGEHTYGMMWRQPISDAMHVRVKYDETLTGGRGIAASERFYRVLQGDADEDPVGISLWNKGSDAYNEAHEAITSGSQMQNLDTFYGLTGLGEDSMTIKNSQLTSLQDRFNKYHGLASNIDKTINNRTAGGAIGAFSNELSGIMESVAANSDIVRNPNQASRMKHLLFNFIRQVPISARKSHLPYDMQDALRDQKNIASAFANQDEDTAFNNLHETMSGLAEKFGKNTNWNEELADRLGDLGIPKQEGSFNPASAYLNSDVGKQDIRDLLRSRSETSKVRSSMLMGTGKIKDLIDNVKNIGFDEVAGSIHGYAASVAASQQGNINAEIRDAAKATRNSFRDVSRAFTENHGKAALIGLGAVAALGLLSSPNRRSISMSSNKYRPEETAGVQDSVPGMPIAGTESANAPRNIVREQQGVTSAMVAPLNNAVNTDINLRAKDNAGSIEMAKSMARLTGSGKQHVNVNYSKDPRIGSLRFRDKLKEMRDR